MEDIGDSSVTDKAKAEFLHCRMSRDMLDLIDTVASHYGLEERSAVVRLVFTADARRLGLLPTQQLLPAPDPDIVAVKPPKKSAKKSG